MKCYLVSYQSLSDDVCLSFIICLKIASLFCSEEEGAAWVVLTAFETPSFFCLAGFASFFSLAELAGDDGFDGFEGRAEGSCPLASDALFADDVGVTSCGEALDGTGLGMVSIGATESTSHEAIESVKTDVAGVPPPVG